MHFRNVQYINVIVVMCNIWIIFAIKKYHYNYITVWLLASLEMVHNTNSLLYFLVIENEIVLQIIIISNTTHWKFSFLIFIMNIFLSIHTSVTEVEPSLLHSTLLYQLIFSMVIFIRYVAVVSLTTLNVENICNCTILILFSLLLSSSV